MGGEGNGGRYLSSAGEGDWIRWTFRAFSEVCGVGSGAVGAGGWSVFPLLCAGGGEVATRALDAAGREVAALCRVAEVLAAMAL